MKKLNKNSFLNLSTMIIIFFSIITVSCYQKNVKSFQNEKINSNSLLISPIETKVLVKDREEPYYLVDQGKEVIINLKVKREESPGSKVNLELKIDDFWNNTVYDENIITEINKSNLAENSFKVNVPTKLGYYQINALVNKQEIIDKSNDRQFTYSFGVVDPVIKTNTLEPNSPYGIAMRGKVVDDQMMETLQRVGIKWARNGIIARWSDIEKKQGDFDYSKNLDFLKRLNSHGISRLERLDGIPRWNQQSVVQNSEKKNSEKKINKQSKSIADAGNLDQKKNKKKLKDKEIGSIMLPKNIDDWKKYVQKTISTLYPMAQYYEVWNEPDIPKRFWRDSMENYVKLLNASYDAKKQENPNASILMAGFTGAHSNTEKPQKRKWLELALTTGKYDIMNFHSYGSLEQHEERYKVFNEILQKYNLPKKPIWITETGSLVWRASPKIKNKNNSEDNSIKPVNNPVKPVYTEKEQARNYVQNFLVGKSYGVDKFFTHANIKFSLEEDYGVIRKNNTPRQWMLAQAALAKWIHDAKFVKSSSEKTLRKFLFSRDGQEITALFNQGGGMKNLLVKTEGAADFIDMMGNPSERVKNSSNNQYQVSVDDYPVYVIGSVKAIEEIKK